MLYCNTSTPGTTLPAINLEDKLMGRQIAMLKVLIDFLHGPCPNPQSFVLCHRNHGICSVLMLQEACNELLSPFALCNHSQKDSQLSFFNLIKLYPSSPFHKFSSLCIKMGALVFQYKCCYDSTQELLTMI